MCKKCKYFDPVWSRCKKRTIMTAPETEKCEYFKPITNFDIINGMGEIEFADWLSEKMNCSECPCKLNCNGDTVCSELLQIWLEAEA